MNVKAFIYHKKAEKYSDCQDCFGIDSRNNRIAVSDGMSQSIFPQWWAQILVDEYLEKGTIPRDILPLQEKWQQKLRDEIRRREEEAITNPRRDPWRLRNLLSERSGAGATLCGLTLGDKEWLCECLGDSCVITINPDYTLNFYTSQVGEFGNHPDYFDSFGEGRGEPINKTVNQEVKAILMVTDPFAELFQIHENDRDFIKARFEELQNLTSHQSFTELVDRWRDDLGMHNDDSTLVLIDDLSNSNLTVEHEDELKELCKIEANNDGCEPIKKDDKPIVTPEKIDGSDPDIQAERDFKPTNFKEALDNFIKALHFLLEFYPGKKKERKLKEWISNYTTPNIKIFCNK